MNTTTTKIAGEAMTDEQILELASDAFGIDYDRLDCRFTNFARALLASKPAVDAGACRAGFEQQRKVGINVDWFTWQIAWHDAIFTQVDCAASPAAPAQPCGDAEQADEAVTDAERYQWLKENRPVLLMTGFFGNGCINRTIGEVDAAIDAARAKASK